MKQIGLALVVALMTTLTGCAETMKTTIEVDCQDNILYYTFTQKVQDENGNDIRLLRKETGVMTYRNDKIVHCNSGE